MSDINQSKKTGARFGKYGITLLKQWLLFPLIGTFIGTLILGRIVNAVLKPQSYYVYFVGPLNYQSSAEDDPIHQIRDGLYAENPSLGSLDEVPVVLQEISDHGDERTAERISQELAERKETLMVVGHVTSTTTRAALPAYLKQVSPPIPMILTAETNPDLLPPDSNGFQPVYRLSPTDFQQAQVAACFVELQKAKAIWVVEAGSNHVYTRYLAQQFIGRVQESGDSKVLLWSTSLDRPVVDAVEALKIDWIFYAGDWQNALVLLRQLRAALTGKPIPKLILSDSSMDPRLPKLAGPESKDIYLTFPLAYQRFQEQGGYAIYGKDARKLITQAINETQANFDTYARDGRGLRRTLNWLLGLKRAADARNALRSYMKEKAEHKEGFLLGDTKLYFNSEGLPQNRSFSVWQVKDGTFAAAVQDAQCSSR